ncbi:hypothetical protein BKA63DRAFT_568997 [Paraphoma chrysanthemicola]|nr:hypothetical protein BKA63DRAFT_568997 [Paraphoma chrysanthemicola]
MASSPPSTPGSLSTLDMALALVIPLACVCIALTAIIINMVRLRRPKSSTHVENCLEDGKAELPGNAVDMFVELDGRNDEVVKKERGKAKELDGRGVGTIRTV